MEQELNAIFEELAKHPSAKRVKNYEVIVKCPICGEPGHHSRGQHCHVTLINGKPPVVYHCFLNECKGKVTPDFLHALDIFDTEIDSMCVQVNASSRNNLNPESKIYKITKKKENLKIPDVQDSVENRAKLDYLRHRLGIKFHYEHLKDLKIIFSIKDFIELNKIQFNMSYKYFAPLMEQQSIGFLCTTNDYIQFRNIYKTDVGRFVKYKIFPNIDETTNSYTIPHMHCDMFADRVNLNIAEGMFDILGVYIHLYKNCKENNIYVACCGSNYISTAKYFIKLGFIGNLVVNIYSDQDRQPEYYRKFVNELRPWVKEINLFYNELGKDFGVRAKEIKLTQVNLKVALQQQKKKWSY